MKLVVIIPAYKEEKAIGGVVKRVPKRIPGIDETIVLVVDDGSPDETGRIAREAGAVVVRHMLNQGKGIGLDTGFQAARLLGADVAVTLDADGQHDPKEIPQMVGPILAHGVDFVVGSRFLAGTTGMPWRRRLYNQASNWVTRLLYGVKATDTICGYRAFSRKALGVLRYPSYGYEAEVELFSQVKRHRLQYAEVPIKTIYTDYSRSKGLGFSQAITMLFTLVFRLIRGYR